MTSIHVQRYSIIYSFYMIKPSLKRLCNFNTYASIKTQTKPLFSILFHFQTLSYSVSFHFYVDGPAEVEQISHVESVIVAVSCFRALNYVNNGIFLGF